MRTERAAWWFVAPALIVLGVFFFIPVVGAFVMSLTDFDLYAFSDLDNLRFIGFENYRRTAAGAAVLESRSATRFTSWRSAYRCRSGCRLPLRCW